MKRFAAALALLALFGVGEASAAHFTSKEVYWRNENAYNISAGRRDTIATVIAVGATDTTNWVSTDGWAIPCAATVDGDSLVIGQFIVFQDSTADGAETATSFTINIDVAGNGNDVAAQSLGAVTFTDITAGNEAIKFPLWIQTAKAAAAGIGTQGWNHVWPNLRLRIVAIGGVLTGSVKCKIVHLED